MYLGMQRAIIQGAGLSMVAYEGGQHLATTNGVPFSEALTALVTEANRSPRMYDLYQQLFDAWFDAGGEPFVAYASARRPSGWGPFGLLEYITQPLSQAHKYRAVLDRRAQIEGPASEPVEPAVGVVAIVAVPAGMSLIG